MQNLRLTRILPILGNSLNDRAVLPSKASKINLITQNLSPGIYFLLVNGEEMVKVSAQ